MTRQYNALALSILVSSSLISGYAAQAATTAGKTMVVKGDVQAFETEADSRQLQRRSPIYDIDTVTTKANSKAQFRMTDGTLLALKESSQILISEYQYEPGNEGNSAVIELVEGGLRSVTGAIKSNNGSYQLKTPVGSIGIRGTHFEIELINGDMFLAVWDGAIDVTVNSGSGSDTVSFGEGEDFSFGVISENGEVTSLLEAPENFNQGHGSDNDGDDDGNDRDGDSSEGGFANNDGDDDGDNEGGDDFGDDSDEGVDFGDFDDDNEGGDDGDEGDFASNDSEQDSANQERLEGVLDINSPADPVVIENKVGEFTYSGLVESSFSSTAGGASNLQVNMTVDFDINFMTGDLSLTDNGGEWLALFAGAVDGSDLIIDIGTAYHGNEIADGTINGFFGDNGNRIIGNFNLFEVNTPTTSTTGSFIIN
ncbi:FecR domain-containing protein [Paraneptunicella aestuarii]|uniref:FecR family protein n=1 Tax=Paraneptunicella aestuarii TaxID=2831148 RepID=UPI001E648C6C|nr:FecR family protein [Paraneptunicella aestuarii]UAA39873.1 FecR domain-containing protein [Paraneptunicella aestuarii]